MPTQATIPVTPGSGVLLDAVSLVISAQTVVRETMVIADPSNATQLAGVTAGGALQVDASATVQPISGTITAVTSITNPVTIVQPTAGNLNATVVGTGTFAVQASITTLGQQLAAASVPVVLTAAQITTLTPPTTVAVTQSTNPWIVAGGGTAGSAATGVITVQGIASMTPLLVTATFSAPQHVIIDSGTVTAVTSITNPVTVSQATAGNLNATVVGTGTFAVQASITTLGQQLAAASVPVVLTAAQLSTLTPLTTVAVTQSTSPWIVAGGGTAGTAATGVVTVQGIASMTPLLVTATFSAPQHVIVDSGTIAVTQSTSPWVTNITQWGGTNVVTGGVNGSVGIGGLAAADAAQSGNPVLIGGVDASGNIQELPVADFNTATPSQTLIVGGIGNAGVVTQLSFGGVLNGLAIIGNNNPGDGQGNGVVGGLISSGSSNNYLLEIAPFVFNGTTWDRKRSGGATGSTMVAGAAAVGAATSGNPVYVAGKDVSGNIQALFFRNAIGTGTVPPTFTTAGAANSDPAAVMTLSPNSGIPAIVQKISGTGSGAQASLATSNFASNVTAGNSIVVVVGVGNNGAVGITDTLGNSYTQARVQLNGTTFQVAIFYATNIKGGVNAVTVTPSASVSLSIAAYEVAGIIGVGGGGSTTTTPSTVNQQGSVDGIASASGSSVTPASGATTIQFPNEIAFGGIAIGTANQTPSAFTPWNKDFDLVVGGSPSGLFGLHTFSQPLGAGGAAVSLTATITSEPWAAAIVTFIPALHAVGGFIAANITQWGGSAVVTGGVAGSVGVGGLAVNNTSLVGNPVWIGGSTSSGTVIGLNLASGAALGAPILGLITSGTDSSTVVVCPAQQTGTSTAGLATQPSFFNGAGTAYERGRSATIGNAVASTGLQATVPYGEYLSTPPTPTTGQYSAVQTDYAGSIFTRPARRSTTTSKATTIASSAAATTVLAAQAAGIFADISTLVITVTPAATTDLAFTATLSDGTNSYIYDMDTGALATATADPTIINISFNPPLPATTAATAWTIQLSVATVTVHITVVAVLQKAS